MIGDLIYPSFYNYRFTQVSTTTEVFFLVKSLDSRSNDSFVLDLSSLWALKERKTSGLSTKENSL